MACVFTFFTASYCLDSAILSGFLLTFPKSLNAESQCPPLQCLVTTVLISVFVNPTILGTSNHHIIAVLLYLAYFT